MKTPDPRAQWQAVDDWLAVAQEDRRVAADLYSSRTAAAWGFCVSLPAGGRKAAQGLSDARRQAWRQDAFLNQLGTAAAASFSEIAELVAASRDWSNWAVDFRYPARRGRAKPPPDADELRRALEVIDALAERLRAVNLEPSGS